MKIILGLGNPEKKYEQTYHNLGFIAVDNLAKKLGFDFKLKSSLKCALAQGLYMGEKVILVKPTTYMNLSGECVQKVLSFYNVQPSDLLVIYDDLDIDIGLIKVRPYGSAGTHNGMRNIVANINSTLFPRIRIGTKPQNDNIPIIDYVLSKIPEAQFEVLNKAISNASDCAIDFIKNNSIDLLMQKYNGKVTSLT